ncbi:hypothetical protein V2J09_001133 [Rumex salicifolius]
MSPFPHTSEPSGSYVCSDGNCDCPDECGGDHTYSNWRLQPEDFDELIGVDQPVKSLVEEKEESKEEDVVVEESEDGEADSDLVVDASFDSEASSS